MYKEIRLPRNRKEGTIFLLTVSIISVNTFASIIIGLEHGFSNAKKYVVSMKGDENLFKSLLKHLNE
ncbi:hypothetical protein [Bacillus thuringiensis]|uniref:hypothetical protein n=1 Tax=Bacillus thuringiensis TaxID=1428 RepID=UPI000BF97DD1|nr:hypothetical protein [Bacillus thuringiensis]